MKVELNKSEVEEAIKRYIKTEYLSQHHRFNISEVNFITSYGDSIEKDDALDAEVTVEKLEQQTPAPCPPSY